MSNELQSSPSGENQEIMKGSLSNSFTKASQTQHEASKHLLAETAITVQGDNAVDTDGLVSLTTEKSSPESYSSDKNSLCQDKLVFEETTGDDQPSMNHSKKETKISSKAQDTLPERQENIEKQNVVKILAVAKEKKSNKKRLLSDIHQVMSNDDLPFEMYQVDEDRFDQWIVRLKGFDGDSELAKDMKVLGLEYIEMQMNFPDDYPFAPPFVFITKPRFQRGTGYVLDGAICMELLTPKGWSPATSIEGIIVSIQSHLVIGKGRLETVVQMGKKKRERILKKMHNIENGKISLGSSIINNDVSASSVMEKSSESRDEKVDDNQDQRGNVRKIGWRRRRPKAKRGFIKRLFMNCLVNKGNLQNHNDNYDAEEGQVTNKNYSQIAGAYTVNEAQRSFQSIVKIHKKQGWSKSKLKS